MEIIIDQLKLMINKRKRYSSATVIASLIFYTQSSSTYGLLRTVLILPHPRYLKHISSSLSVSAESESNNSNYFGVISKNLSNLERKVIIQIDEIYLSGSLHYKSESIVGYAENNPEIVAKTAQAFMVSSVFGNFQEIVRLFSQMD